jgi:hypothetical protein
MAHVILEDWLLEQPIGSAAAVAVPELPASPDGEPVAVDEGQAAPAAGGP